MLALTVWLWLKINYCSTACCAILCFYWYAILLYVNHTVQTMSWVTQPRTVTDWLIACRYIFTLFLLLGLQVATLAYRWPICKNKFSCLTNYLFLSIILQLIMFCHAICISTFLRIIRYQFKMFSRQFFVWLLTRGINSATMRDSRSGAAC